MLATYLRQDTTKMISKPLDILDAVPKEEDTMYSLVYMTMLALVAKNMSWDQSMIDEQAQR